jgi:DNA-3-methyladenine glycosylase
LFLDGGHIYMYYARGGDSLNFSAHGPGNAVLIKSAYPWVDALSRARSLAQMLLNNPDAQAAAPARAPVRRPDPAVPGPGPESAALGRQAFRPERCTSRTAATPCPGHPGHPPGHPHGRDEHLPYRFVDAEYARFCTRNPLRRGQVEGRDFFILEQGS